MRTRNKAERAADYAFKNAEPKSVGKCAMYVRIALEVCGIDIPNEIQPASAYKYVDVLPQIGFVEVTENEVQKGTISVWSNTKQHPHGHIAIRHNGVWVSDFVQKTVMVWKSGVGDSVVRYFNYVE